eukprot:3413685-Amphidinium_carterae.1
MATSVCNQWHLKEWPSETRKHHVYYAALTAHCDQAVSPENKVTALLITHRHRSDTCRKPGTAFTMEYQMP